MGAEYHPADRGDRTKFVKIAIKINYLINFLPTAPEDWVQIQREG
jgi:hypothetical protein